jgi:hypothetical protein
MRDGQSQRLAIETSSVSDTAVARLKSQRRMVCECTTLTSDL